MKPVTVMRRTKQIPMNGPIRIREMLETFKRRVGTYFPRPGPRFTAWLPGTPVFGRHSRRSFWMVSWYDEIRHVNAMMRRK